MALRQPFRSAHRRGVVRCGAQPLLGHRAPPRLTIKAGLVPDLRSGLRNEIAGALDVLRAHIENGRVLIDKPKYRAALADLDSARALLDTIGLHDDADGRDIELDSERWGKLVSRVIDAQYELKVNRLADLAAGGFPLRRKGHRVHTFAEQVAQLRGADGSVSPGRALMGWPRRSRDSHL